MRNKINEDLLFAYYGGLLNTHQREIMKMYCEYDMSLSEMSKESGLTRQGVRDIIVRSVSKLEKFEERLGLTEKIKKIIMQAEELLKEESLDDVLKNKITNLIDEIKEI